MSRPNDFAFFSRRDASKVEDALIRSRANHSEDQDTKELKESDEALVLFQPSHYKSIVQCQALTDFQLNVQSMLSNPLSEDLGFDVFSPAGGVGTNKDKASSLIPQSIDIEQIQQRLPAQRNALQNAKGSLNREGDLIFEERKETRQDILEMPKEWTQRISTVMERVITDWKKKYEAELDQLLAKDLTQLDSKSLEEHLEALKSFQKNVFEYCLTLLVKNLKLPIPKIDNFTNILSALLQNQLRSQPIGCDLYAVEVSSKDEITLTFCQEHYKTFLPVLIKQRTQNGPDKIWVYGHKKSLTGLIPTIEEALTPLTLPLYRRISFGTEAQPKRLEREDNLFQIYHDVVTKGGHFISHPKDFFKELIPKLAEKLPLLRRSAQDQFFVIVEKIKAMIQRVDEYWKNVAPADGFHEACKELLAKTKPFLEVFPELHSTPAESKEESEAQIFAFSKENVSNEIKKLLEKLQPMITAELEKIAKEKISIESRVVMPDFKRLYELAEQTIKWRDLQAQATILKLLLQGFLEKYSDSNQKTFSIEQYSARFKAELAFIDEFKNNYRQLSNHIENVEMEIEHHRQISETSLSPEGRKALEGWLLSQLEFIQSALYSHTSASSMTFFTEAFNSLEVICRAMEGHGLIGQELLTSVKVARGVWGPLQLNAESAFKTFKIGIQERGQDPALLWVDKEQTTSLDQSIERLIEYLAKNKDHEDQSQEFVEAGTQLNLCLAAWKASDLYKKRQEKVKEEDLQFTQEQKESQEATALSAILLQQQERFKKGNHQVAEYIRRFSDNNPIGDCLEKFEGHHRSKMLSMSATSELLSRIEKTLNTQQLSIEKALAFVIPYVEYHVLESVSQSVQQSIVAGLTLWQEAKEQLKQYQRLLGLSNEITLYVDPITLLNKAVSMLQMFLDAEDTTYQISRKAFFVIEAHKQGLLSLRFFQAPGFPTTSRSDILTRMDKRLQSHRTLVQSFQECAKKILSTQEMLLVDAEQQTALALGLAKIMRSLYAELRSKSQEVYSLHLRMDNIITQQSLCEKQIDRARINHASKETMQQLLTERKALLEELNHLKQLKIQLINGNANQGAAPSKGGLIDLVFNVQAAINKLIGKADLDKQYYQLQSAFLMRKINAQQFGSLLQSLKDQVLKVKARVKFAQECLEEMLHASLMVSTFNPNQYLLGVLSYVTTIEKSMKDFESYKPAERRSTDSSERPSGIKPEPSQMARWSEAQREKLDKFFAKSLEIRESRLQSSRLRAEVDTFFDARQAELEYQFAAERVAFEKRLERVRFQAQELNEADRRQYAESFANVLEAQANNDLLLHYHVLYRKRNQMALKHETESGKRALEIVAAIIQ